MTRSQRGVPNGEKASYEPFPGHEGSMAGLRADMLDKPPSGCPFFVDAIQKTPRDIDASRNRRAPLRVRP
jgi:hypothetical protein